MIYEMIFGKPVSGPNEVAYTHTSRISSSITDESMTNPKRNHPSTTLAGLLIIIQQVVKHVSGQPGSDKELDNLDGITLEVIAASSSRHNLRSTFPEI
jgi:hypothetical protein